MPTLCNTKVDLSACDTKVNKAQTFDLNHDERPDVWKINKTKDERGTTVEYLACKVVDLDHDPKGHKDYIVQFDDNGNPVIELYNFDFDDKIDAQYRYDAKTNKKFLVERDLNSDGKWDVCEEYDTRELLSRIQRDRNFDGKPDLWELYKAGVLEAILYDNDSDGKVDDREEAPRKEAPKTDVPAPLTPDAGVAGEGGGGEGGAEGATEEKKDEAAPATEEKQDEAGGGATEKKKTKGKKGKK
jgi:hypothetical protein